jgi:hypothetical protein
MTCERAFEVLREEVIRGWRQGELVEPFIRLAQSGHFGDLATTPVAPDPRRLRMKVH